MKNNYLVFRLLPGEDLYEGIIKKAVEQHLKAGALISAVGCVKEICIRSADGHTVYREVNDFEVTALSGSISEDGVHIHIQLCDKDMRCLGGHLLTGTTVNTTMEIVILNLENEYRLSREFDDNTGYDELVVTKK